MQETATRCSTVEPEMIDNLPTHEDQSVNNVVICADPRFALGAWIVIWSAFQNSGKNLSFNLLTTGADSRPIRKLQRLAKRAAIPFSIVPVDTQLIDDLPTTGRLPIYMYLRLLAPGVLLHLNRFLYLDSDILVRSSLLPLFAQLPDDKLALGIRDYGYSDIGHGLKKTYQKLGLDPAAPYVNSGVLMINARLWRQDCITRQAVNYLQQYRSMISHPDQDALNAVLSGKLTEADLAWNVQIGAILFFDRLGWPADRAILKRRKAELLSEAKLVHFIGGCKPWRDGLFLPYVKEYRRTIVESGWIPKWRAGPWVVSWHFSAFRQALWRRFPKRGGTLSGRTPTSSTSRKKDASIRRSK
jgi:lipopolysaccharide biosynthesis glycosyltransferase